MRMMLGFDDSFTGVLVTHAMEFMFLGGGRAFPSAPKVMIPWNSGTPHITNFSDTSSHYG